MRPAWRDFVKEAAEEKERFFRRCSLPAPRQGRTDRVINISHMADHIDYLVNVCGSDHVGLGGDVNGIAGHQWSQGMHHVGELINLTAELLRRGWREDDLRRFLGDNFRRVFHECLPEE